MNDYKLLLPENRFQYNFMIYQIGYEACKSDHKFGPLIRDFYVFHFLISGAGFYTIRNQTRRIEKGDAFLIPPNEVISYHADPEDPYEYYWVGFHGINAQEVLTHAGFFRDDTFVCRPEDFELMKQLMKELCDFDASGRKNNLMMLGSFYKLLGVLTKDNVLFEKRDSADEIIAKLVQYIEMNYSSPVTVDNMAKFVNLHRSSVYRIFRNVYNTSPQQYLFDFRMDKALFMLKNSNMFIKEIAYASGFADPTYFCKMFRKKYHKTPQEVRKLL